MESGEIKELVRVKVKNDRSEVKNLKIEVIEERSEKKGIEFLEEVEEKKAVEIMRNKSNKGCENKSVLQNRDKEIKCELKDESDIKQENVNEVKVESTEREKCDGKGIGESVKSEKDLVSVKSETDLSKLNGHVEPSVSDTHIKTEKLSEKVVKGEDKKLDSLCNGDIENSDQKSPQHMTASGSHTTGSSKPSENQTGSSLSLDLETCTTKSSSNEKDTIKSSNDESGAGKTTSKHVELKIPSVKSSAIEQVKSTEVERHSNLFLQIPQSTKLSDFCSFSIDHAMKNDSSKNAGHQPSTTSFSSSLFMNTSFSDHVTKSTNHISLPSPPQPPPAHSKTLLSDRKPSFMSIDSILEKKTGSSQRNQFYPNSVLPVNPFVTQSVRSVSESHTIDSKPWFSLLPRVPCDDMSLTRGQHTSISSGIMLSPPFMSQLPFHPFSVQSPSFSSFQMGQLFNTSADQSLTVTSSSTSTVPSVTQSSDSSFKKPEPVSSQNPDPEQVLKSLQGEAKPIPEGKHYMYVVKIPIEQVPCRIKF